MEGDRESRIKNSPSEKLRLFIFVANRWQFLGNLLHSFLYAIICTKREESGKNSSVFCISLTGSRSLLEAALRYEGGCMVGRFQVMALLQAARAKVLGHPLDEAQSFGLNRAIFYAAAKRGFKGGPSAKQPGKQQTLKTTPSNSITRTRQEDATRNHIT